MRWGKEGARKGVHCSPHNIIILQIVLGHVWRAVSTMTCSLDILYILVN